jgi:hypothetical protein
MRENQGELLQEPQNDAFEIARRDRVPAIKKSVAFLQHLAGMDGSIENNTEEHAPETELQEAA